VKKKTTVSPGLFAAAMLQSIFIWSSTTVLATAPCTNAVFTPVFVQLQTKTKVPLRLPAILADDYDAALYAEVGAISPTRYVVRIGQNCERGYCAYGKVSGTKISRRTGRPNGRSIKLAGGVMGRLIDGSKRLTDSILTWDEGGYRYAISIYASEPTALIRIVNSALTCDNR
jgi:hypothetical protein